MRYLVPIDRHFGGATVKHVVFPETRRPTKNTAMTKMSKLTNRSLAACVVRAPRPENSLTIPAEPAIERYENADIQNSKGPL